MNFKYQNQFLFLKNILILSTLLWTRPIHSKTVKSSLNTVVLELYTSQGCSSCPRADAILKEVKNLAQTNQNIIPLSFHVTYWNYLGWKDVFSQESFSKRQRMMAATLKSSVYTPQIFINGSYECIGSDRNKIINQVSKYLKEQKNSLSYDLRIENDSKKVYLTISFFNNNPKNLDLNVGLVQKEAIVNIKSGENRGKILTYNNVVRVFKTFSLSYQSTIQTTLEFPKDLNLDDFFIVSYTQDTTTQKVMNATPLTSI